MPVDFDRTKGHLPLAHKVLLGPDVLFTSFAYSVFCYVSGLSGPTVPAYFLMSPHGTLALELVGRTTDGFSHGK